MHDESGGKALAGARILVVEDEYYLADDIARSLRKRGGEAIGPVATLAQAESALAANRLDCAILDLNLRGRMAYPVADRLAEAGIPFLFATGYGNEVIPARFDGVRRLHKPVDADRLVELIPAVIASVPA